MPMQTGTAIRETIYTGSYLGLCPVLQTYIDRTVLAREGPPGASLVVSGISTGLFASFVTQPIDTAKTRMQAFIDPKVTHPAKQDSYPYSTCHCPGGQQCLPQRVSNPVCETGMDGGRRYHFQ